MICSEWKQCIVHDVSFLQSAEVETDFVFFRCVGGNYSTESLQNISVLLLRGARCVVRSTVTCDLVSVTWIRSCLLGEMESHSSRQSLLHDMYKQARKIGIIVSCQFDDKHENIYYLNHFDLSNQARLDFQH